VRHGCGLVYDQVRASVKLHERRGRAGGRRILPQVFLAHWSSMASATGVWVV
jgi:hypothetical protein